MNEAPLILIVDDQADNRFTMKLALKKEGYDFIEAENGEEAFIKALEHKPDVILMDAIMPVMDGFESTNKILQEQSLERTPILMVTALNEKADRIKAIEAGVSDFISKPFDKHEIIARCRSYVNMSLLNKRYISATYNHRTGIVNKEAMEDAIEKSLLHEKLVLIWINGFESIEEFYGQTLAIELEIKFAQFLRSHVTHESAYDIYHTGKGEFCILFDDKFELITNSELEVFCIALQASVKKFLFELTTNKTILDINCSLSYISETSNIYEKVRAGLKQALRFNKRIVDAQEVIEDVHEEILNNITWTRKIKEALDEGRIRVFYQALYNNKTNEIEKYESLVRLIEEDGKVISPFFFLDIAQKSNYYLAITKTVFDQACETFSTRDKEFSVNLSGIDIEDDETRNHIINHLEANPSIAKKIVFELLEDENFSDFKVLSSFITKVKSMGAKIAIDDFGSGYSNFIRLLDFQPDILKIDGSLIKHIATDEFSLNVVKTMKDFADKIGIKTVAEFVSDGDIQKIIQELNIDYSQGYFIAEPLPVEKI